MTKRKRTRWGQQHPWQREAVGAVCKRGHGPDHHRYRPNRGYFCYTCQKLMAATLGMRRRELELLGDTAGYVQVIFGP